MAPKAVVFTHLGQLRAPEYGAVNVRDVEKRYGGLFEAYARCSNVSVVYLYVDWAIRQAVKGGAISSTLGTAFAKGFPVDQSLLTRENDLRGALKPLIDRHQGRTGPKFVVVGTRELISVFDKLSDSEPDLVRYLWGRTGTFTYDSPKFTEAVLILSRGQTAHLAANPILRFDEDVMPNESSIAVLLKAFQKESTERGYYFFSGRYGSSPELHQYDPVNDHAGRTHAFAPPGTLPGDRFGKNKHPGEVDSSKRAEALRWCRTFLADISQLGAAQEWPLDKGFSLATSVPLASAEGAAYTSTNMKERLKRGLLTRHRDAQQVISGAGLVMSRRAVALLPPFTGFENNTMWVDDFIKRLLHEALRDIHPDDRMSVPEAWFQQNRHPEGTPDPVGAGDYFERILRGCMLARIVALDPSSDRPTAFAEAVKRRVLFQPRQEDEGALKQEIEKNAEERGRDALAAWTSEDYARTRLHQWAVEKSKDSDYLPTIAREMAQDCIRYVDFLDRWPAFVRAVDRVPILAEPWLFET